jgi:hypothetical protein
VWSVTYPTSFWNESYCGDTETGQQAGVCAAGNPTRPAACDVDVSANGYARAAALGVSLGAFAGICPELDIIQNLELPAEGFRAAVCGCLRNTAETSLEDAIIIANSINAVLGFNFTTISVEPPRDVKAPAQCSNATFVPPRNLFVCNAEGVASNSTDVCTCPKAIPFFLWYYADTVLACFDFVTAVAEGGKCAQACLTPTAPAAVDSQALGIGKCRISTCPCPEFDPFSQK